jgi:predicted nucleic acid-binding protein
MQLGDGVIAASALDHGLTIFTANVKHFGAIDGLQIEGFMP